MTEPNPLAPNETLETSGLPINVACPTCHVDAGDACVFEQPPTFRGHHLFHTKREQAFALWYIKEPVGVVPLTLTDAELLELARVIVEADPNAPPFADLPLAYREALLQGGRAFLRALAELGYRVERPR